MKKQKTAHGLSLKIKTGLTILAITGFSACTKQLPGSLRNSQVTENMDAVTFNTMVDLLFVVDNSQSMDVVQKRMRTALSAFANQYLKPNWDMQIGVITTDTYIAHNAFSGYLARPIKTFSGNNPTSRIVGKYYAQIQGSADATEVTRKNKLDTYINLGASDIVIADPDKYVRFNDNYTYNALVPAWGTDYAKLITGKHDGPIAGFCAEQLPFFSAPDKGGNSIVGPKCQIRDQSTTLISADDCLNATGNDDIHQCVNTVLNDTVHSNKAILKTIKGNGFTDAQWVEQLTKDFKINVSTGTSGHGSERGLSSLEQFLRDNEGYQGVAAASKFFRKGSTRAIIILSDEDDQSLEMPAAPANDFTPFTDYKCDLKVLIEKNLYRYPIGQNGINNAQDQYQATLDLVAGKKNGLNYEGSFYCCPSGREGGDPNMACTFTYPGTIENNIDDLQYACPRRTLGNKTFGVHICPDENKLIPVANFKTQLDEYFGDLDEDSATGEASYFIAAIIPDSESTYNAFDGDRILDDDRVNVSVTKAPVDSAERYRVLVNTVAQGSMILDIGTNDYGPLLSQIGSQIVERKGKFTLKRTPTAQENMIVNIVNSSGQTTVLSSNQFSISGRTLTITDANVVLGLESGSRVVTVYDPQTSFD